MIAKPQPFDANEFLAAASRGNRRPQAKAMADRLRRVADWIEANTVTPDEVVAAGYAAVGHYTIHLEPEAFAVLCREYEVTKDGEHLSCQHAGIRFCAVLDEEPQP
jgi:hypothetical protein